MSQWKNDDSAANSVLWGVVGYNKTGNSANRDVFFGNTNTEPILNTDEAAAFRWVSILDLKREIQDAPHRFTYWFPIALNKFF